MFYCTLYLMPRVLSHWGRNQRAPVGSYESPRDESMIEPSVAIDLLEAIPNPGIEDLRDRALARQQAGIHTVPTMPLIDAQAWTERAVNEDWLLWRARRTAARLELMPIDVSQGERIAGRPQLRSPTPDEAEQIEALRPLLETIPPYPGGDAGHFHPDFDKLFDLGIDGIRREILARRQGATVEQHTFYRACTTALDGLSRYILRVGEECDRLAAQTGDDQLADLGPICRQIATEPPATFHAGLQLMFLTIVGLWFAEDHGLTTPGRMDQTLRRLYEADLVMGVVDPEEALELIGCLYIQLNNLLGAGAAVSVMVGGRDPEGEDATCDLTYLCLAARQMTRLVYPTVGLAWHEQTPAELTEFACRMLRTGIGDPAFFNDELIASGLRANGVSEVDARNYMNSTCVEIKVVGTSNIWVASPYFNCAQQLLDTIDQVADGRVADPPTFEDFEELVRESFVATVREAAKRLDTVWKQRAETGGFPLASCLIDDCLAKARDFDRGGARYNWVENSFVGLANLADGLVAIQHLVYGGEMSLSQLRQILRRNFEGEEPLRQRILNRLPSYGNADDTADATAAKWAQALIDITATNTVGPHAYVPGFFCWVMHGRLGEATGATPDGRRAGVALADGAGAAQGRDRRGPTASVLSTTRWNHEAALGGLVHNVRFSRSLLGSESGLQALRHVIETYMQCGGFEIQVNVVGADLLRAAQSNPEEHADLLVRVAGYSDYFVHLDDTLQAQVIERTEHESV